MTRPIGLLGGTFDPVHHGHLRVALELQQSLNLAEVRLIPLHTPPHRDQPVASPEQRLTMLKLAIKNIKNIVIDDRELKHAGISYTVDTVRELRNELNDQSLCLIMGMDAIQTLNSWHQWTLLLEYVHIIIVDRPGNKLLFEQQDIAKLYSDHSIDHPSGLEQAPAGNILRTNSPMLDISATRIRKLIIKNINVQFLLPENVISYIQQENLYGISV